MSLSARESAQIVDLGCAAEAVVVAADVSSGDDEGVSRGEEYWRSARTAEMDELLEWLWEIDRRLPGKLQGAWHVLGTRGPDRVSQAANSGVELIDWTLRRLAPDVDVLAWREGSGMYSGEVGGNGIPHRSLKVRYIVRNSKVSSAGVDKIISSLMGSMKELQGFKHAGEGDRERGLRVCLVGLEYLLMTLRGLLEA
jgi:hypothetical protein